MIKTQIQIPDHLHRAAKRIAAEYEMSFAEVVRRGIERIVPAYPPRSAGGAEWTLPRLDFGLLRDPFADPDLTMGVPLSPQLTYVDRSRLRLACFQVNLRTMKATIDIPDDLYRQLKAKSALEGRAVREVTAELFQLYVEGRLAERLRRREPTRADAGEDRLPAWVGVARHLISPDATHEWEEVRRGIDRGWADEVAEAAPPNEARQHEPARAAKRRRRR